MKQIVRNLTDVDDVFLKRRWAFIDAPASPLPKMTYRSSDLEMSVRGP